MLTARHSEMEVRVFTATLPQGEEGCCSRSSIGRAHSQRIDGWLKRRKSTTQSVSTRADERLIPVCQADLKSVHTVARDRLRCGRHLSIPRPRRHRTFTRGAERFIGTGPLLFRFPPPADAEWPEQRRRASRSDGRAALAGPVLLALSRMTDASWMVRSSAAARSEKGMRRARRAALGD